MKPESGKTWDPGDFAYWGALAGMTLAFVLKPYRVFGGRFDDIDPGWLAGKTAATPPPAPEALPLEARIQVLEARIATLEATIQALRAELALAQAPPKPSAPPVDKKAQSLTLTAPLPPPPDAAPATVVTEIGFWLSETGVRHNRTCRYYMKSQGRLVCG